MTPHFAHHLRLERLFDTLVTQAAEGDPVRVREQWGQFEHDLLQHMQEEETAMLPAFARYHPEEAARFRKEHDDIRRRLLELGIDLDLHQLRESTVREFVDQLRDHARREEALLYPWEQAEPHTWPRHEIA
jgi:hemerythrin superfamily protein